MFRNQRTYARLIGTTQSISATTTSARTSAGVGTQVRLVRVASDPNSSAVAYVTVGNSTHEATTGTGLPLFPGTEYHMAIDPGEYVAAICAANTATVYVTELDS